MTAREPGSLATNPRNSLQARIGRNEALLGRLRQSTDDAPSRSAAHWQAIQDRMDEAAFHPSVNFTRNMGAPNGPEALRGQMAISHRVDDGHLHPAYRSQWVSKEWGHLTPMRQPEHPSEQLALPFNHPSAEPTDPVMHGLRQKNPALNDYQFGMSLDDDGSGQVLARHTHSKVMAGELNWASKDGVDIEATDGYKPHEVGYVKTHPEHRGKGIAVAMWDYANANGATPVHSSTRSEHGEAFARRSGGPAYTRVEGRGTQEY